ncbi:hypothetical protein ACQJBY_056235 [Aegilops geniculata]
MATAAASRPSGPVLLSPFPNYQSASLSRVKLSAGGSPVKSVSVSSPPPPLLPHRRPQDPSVLHVLPDEPPGLLPLQPPQGAQAGGPGRRQLQQAHGQYVRAARPQRQRQL